MCVKKKRRNEKDCMESMLENLNNFLENGNSQGIIFKIKVTFANSNLDIAVLHRLLGN